MANYGFQPHLLEETTSAANVPPPTQHRRMKSTVMSGR